MTASDHEQAARDALRRVALRATPQRIVVLAALMSTSDDMTAQSLHAQLSDSGHELGQATVYRTLGALADAGVIDALQHGHGTCYRWCAPGHHHHLTCDSCHTVVEVRDCDVADWAAQVGHAHGFSDVRHVVELRGTCADCGAA